MELETLILTLETNKRVKEKSSHLRGFLGNKFEEYPILHNHTKEKNIYTYPKVQYMILEGKPIILGIKRGKEVLKKIAWKIDHIDLGKTTYDIKSIQINKKDIKLQPTNDRIQYKFLTPWLALNQNNYKKYKEMEEWKEKKELINNILIGNILSMCKGLNYVVKKELKVRTHVYENKIEYKGIPHIGFTGKLEINFKIPNYIGIGQGVSQGYGTIKKEPKQKNQN